MMTWKYIEVAIFDSKVGKAVGGIEARVYVIERNRAFRPAEKYIADIDNGLYVVFARAYDGIAFEGDFERGRLLHEFQRIEVDIAAVEACIPVIHIAVEIAVGKKRKLGRGVCRLERYGGVAVVETGLCLYVGICHTVVHGVGNINIGIDFCRFYKGVVSTAGHMCLGSHLLYPQEGHKGLHREG